MREILNFTSDYARMEKLIPDTVAKYKRIQITILL